MKDSQQRLPSIVTPRELNLPVRVVDDEGKEIVRPDVLQAVVQLASLGQLARITKALEREHFEGMEDPRTLNATDELQFISLIDYHPNTPWIRAYFINKGPKTVRIAVNHPYDQFELGVWGSRLIDRVHANERIRTIFYVCNPGETASVSVTGEY